MTGRRSTWAEQFFEHFASIPLTAECVYYSPQFLDKGIQKEVCDFLIVLRGEALLVSMKSQEDPTKKTGEKLAGWIVKNAGGAFKQAKGALRTLNSNSFWCQHRRRGRVAFAPRSLKIAHLIVITELFGERVKLPDNLPLVIDDIPVTYLAVNDFLNLVYELRTFPDVSAYLNARRGLSAITLRTVGDERPLFEYYILNKGSLAGCLGYEDARIMAAANEHNLEMYRQFVAIRDQHAGIIECVSDRLATRLDDYAEGLRPEVAAFYDDPANRKNYLLLQEELCDLDLAARRAVGMQFTHVIEKVEKSNEEAPMSFGAAYVDSKPDFVYVLVSARGVTRPELIKRSNILLRAAMACYKRPRGMVIAERDGKNFEVQMIAGFTPDEADVQLGEFYFSRLKISDV
jgi:hypothetical protein